MYQLIYVSSATDKFTDQHLRELLQQARDKNAALELTGMLLYIDGNFIQVLEGEKDKVLDLFNRIKLDSRHQGAIQLLAKEIIQRNFPEWTMGFKSLTLSEASKITGYTKLTEDMFKKSGNDISNHPAISLLKTFYKSNTR